MPKCCKECWGYEGCEYMNGCCAVCHYYDEKNDECTYGGYEDEYDNVNMTNTMMDIKR